MKKVSVILAIIVVLILTWLGSLMMNVQKAKNKEGIFLSPNKSKSVEFINAIGTSQLLMNFHENLIIGGSNIVSGNFNETEIGISDVKITHESGSRPEFGKDLIASRYDEIEDRKIWSAFVVKKGAVSGNSTMINEIANQVQECFEYPYDSIEHKQKVYINNVKVVTNLHISSGAKDKIKIHNNLKQANIDFWDGEKIIKLIDKNFPKYWLQGSKQYKKYIEKFENLISRENSIKALGLNEDKIERILNNFISPKLKEYYENEDGELKTRIKETNSIINLPDNSIIVGQPGSGKSTLIKELAKEIIQQNSIRNNFELYPIILSFRSLKDCEFNFDSCTV